MSGGGGRPTRPPRIARLLLEWALPEHDRPFVLGDLDQRFQEMARSGRVWTGHRWYWAQALSALRVRGAWPHPDPTVQVRRSGVGDALGEAWRAVRIAIRSLSRRPALAIVSVAALAMGVGATTTAFSVVWGTVLRGLPFERADRLIHFERQNLAAEQLSLAVTPHDFVAWREGQTAFEDLAAFVEAVAQLPTDGGPPARYSGVFMTANTFRLLRASPMLGRTFAEEEDRPGGPAVAVIGHGIWTQHFGADPDIVGREVVLSGTPTTVIGVMPEGFGFPIAEQVWLPLRLDLSAVERGGGRLDVFGRLRDTVTLEAARTEMRGLAQRLASAHPETNAGITPIMQTFQEEYVGEDFTRTVYRMLAGGIIVLLVACANVANLLLARARARSGELAVRSALGAGRFRVVGSLLAEAGVLTVVGTLAGIGLAYGGVLWFQRAGTQAGVFPLPHGTAPLFWWDVRVDGASLLFVLAVAVLTTLAAGLLPGVHASRTDPGTTLRSEARGGAGRRSGRFSAGLVIGEVALTTGLLVVAGLLLRSVLAATAASNPVPSDGIMTARVDLPAAALGVSEAAYPDHESRLGLAQAIEEELTLRPGVLAATVVTQLPTERPARTPFSLPSESYSTPDDQPQTWVSTVSTGFFDVFGVDATQGRVLGPEDQAGTGGVALVNQSFAARFYPNGDVLDQRIRLGSVESADPWVTIVGVVPDLWSNDREPEQHTVYVPLAQSGTGEPSVRLGRWGLRFLTLAVRIQGDDAKGVELIRSSVYRADPAIPVYRPRTMATVTAQSSGRYRIWSRFYLGFAGVALFLAALGLYGVMAFGVSARRAEIGIRRALGAPRANVMATVLAAGLRQIGIGAGLGLVLALWLTRGMDRMLFQVDARDPTVFAAVLALVTLVGVAASVLPARRAAAIEPTEALKGL